MASICRIFGGLMFQAFPMLPVVARWPTKVLVCLRVVQGAPKAIFGLINVAACISALPKIHNCHFPKL